MKRNELLDAERQKLLASLDRTLLKRRGITLSDNPTVKELAKVLPKIKALEREALKKLRNEH